MVTARSSDAQDARNRAVGPIVTVIDLPMPPSVNRIWRHNKAGKYAVSRSAEYLAWIKGADQLTMASAQLRGVRMIRGKFATDIRLDRIAGDLDNRHKGVLDWCESRFVIKNDKHNEDLRVRWACATAPAPAGCRITLTELTSL